MTINPVTQLFLEYIDYNYLLGLLFCMSLVFFASKASRLDRNLFNAILLATLFPFLTVFNPLLYNRISKVVGDSHYRFIWAFPFVALSAAFLVETVYLLPKPKKAVTRIITVLLLCSIIMTGKTSYVTKKNFVLPENKFNISRATLDISQFIQDDPDHVDGDVVLAPTEIMMELLAYDVSIISALPRTEYLSYGSGSSQYEPILSVILEGATRNTEYMIWNMYSLDVDYIVCLTLFGLDDYMESIDYDVLNRTGDYTLYKRSPDAHSFY